MDWVYYIILVALLLSGLLLNVLTLPGNWLMVLATIAFGWLTGWKYAGVQTLIALLVLATIGEIVEFLAAGKAASKVGGSFWGAVGAIVGSLLGGIFLTGLIPIPIVGTVIGVLAGTFVGGAVVEKLVGKSINESVMIGAVATKGRFYGMLWKLGFGIIMLVITVVAAIPLW